MSVAKWNAHAAAKDRAVLPRSCTFVTTPPLFVGRHADAHARRGSDRRNAVEKCATHRYVRLGTAIAIGDEVSVRELLVSAASLAIVGALLVAADDRVRERVTAVTPGGVSHHIARGSEQFAIAGSAARDLILDHGPLTILVVAGTVLVVCMLRT